MLSEGDLVEYRPFMGAPTEHGLGITSEHGLGIVLTVGARSERSELGQMAEVLWVKYPGDGPQWYRVKNLRPVQSVP